jgi:isoleucyl-tRNA synthetase
MRPASWPQASIIVWTTTPWTIPGNRAISYSSKISYGLYKVTKAADDNWAKVGDIYVIADKLAAEVFKAARVEEFEKVLSFDASDLLLARAEHPLALLGYDFKVPLLNGDHVTDDTGTGFVHTAPGHGRDDFEVWVANKTKLEAHEIKTEIPYTVDADGSFTKDAPGFTGKRVLKDDGSKGDANDAVIEALKKANMLVARGKLKHSYPHSWRSKTPVIFRNTPQWFIAMDRDISPLPLRERSASVSEPGEGSKINNPSPDVLAAARTSPSPSRGEGKNTLRQLALNAIKATQWVPEQGENRITSMIRERPDWVMSRQRAWGVPITVFVNKENFDILRDEKVNARIIEAFEKEGADAWFKEGAAKRFWPDFDKAKWDMVTDVLDVWFDSGCTHAFTLEKREDLKPRRAPDGADKVMYLEGSDQHRGWFQSSLLEGCGTRGRAPYDIVATHGFLLEQTGEKMSKSMGNMIPIVEGVKLYGADILRLWAAACDFTNDVPFGNEIVKTTTETYRKLRNTLRWMLGTLAHFKEVERIGYLEMPELEKFMLAELALLHDKVTAAYEAFDFKRAVAALTQFMTIDLSAFYFDVRKDALYCDPISSLRRKAALTVVEILFSHLVRYLAPLLCFTAEEAWLSWRPNDGSVHLQSFPGIPSEWRDEVLHGKWETVRQIRKVITGALEIERVAKSIGSSLEAAPEIYLHDAATAKLVNDVDFAEIGITSDASVINGEAPGDAFTLPDVHGVAVVFKPATGKKCARSWRVVKDVGYDPDYPDVSARDAKALREWKALNPA